MFEDIITKRNIYVVPFMFENKLKTFNEIVNQITNDGEWVIQEFNNFESDLYKNILDCFYMSDTDSNIGCSFIFNNKSLEFEYTRFEDFKVSIDKVGLFIFRTNVGFLWYEVNIYSNDLNKCILFQNEFKELSYNRFRKKTSNGRYIFEINDDHYLLMGDYINKTYMSNLPFKVKYFAERTSDIDDTIIPDKALIFNYIIFNNLKEDDLYNGIFCLNNGYNSKYKRKTNFKEELLETFDRTYYYASSLGAGYYAVACEDNYNFYTKTLYRKIMIDYFYLYILTLYQSYSILKFTIDMENKLPASNKAYLNNTQETLYVLKELETDISIFFIKSIYSSVSHISHQNDFYRYLVKRLNVKEDIEDLTIGLDSLYKIENEKENERIEKLKEEENENREKMNNSLNIAISLISIFAILSILPDGYETAKILSNLLGIEYKLCLSIILTISFIIIIIMIIVAIYAFRKFAKSRRKHH